MNINKNISNPIRRRFSGFTKINHLFAAVSLFAVLLIAGCGGPLGDSNQNLASAEIVCDEDNGGITLPDGFCASVVVDSLGPARHIAIGENGDIYVKTRSEEGGIAALRDTTGDFKADIIERFSDMTPMRGGILWETGMAIQIG